VAGGRFPGYHWIYWVGPVLGACIAAGYYHFVKYFRYEEVNPGQDTSRPLTPEPESDPRSAGSKNGTNHTDDSSYRV
jgi:aquaporin related protein